MKQFCALLKKDFLLEARHLEAFITLLFLSILLSVVIAFGVNNAFLEQAVIAKIVPALFWTVFILTATVAIGKTGEYDERMRAVDGVLLTGVSLPTVFLAKMLTNFVLVLCAQAVTLGAFALLFGLDIGEIVLPLMMVVGLVVFAYVNLVTLLSAIAASARLKTLLLPLIGLPLLLPLFFSAVELSSDLFYRRELVWSSEWMSLLVILDVVYFAAGINMYEKVVRE